MKRKRRGIDQGAKVAETSGPVGPDPAELEDLRRKAAERDEYYDGMLRARAELENFRKRMIKERDGVAALTVKNFAASLLDGLDSLERALAAARAALGGAADSSSPFANFAMGVGLVQQQFDAALARHHVVAIPSQGLAFDPAVHEAVSQIEVPGTAAGQVVQELARGYRVGELIVRPSRVVVSRAPAAPVDVQA